MDLLTAAANFRRAIRHSDNLIAVHRSTNSGRGRRTKEISLNRAAIVLAVATWQASVEDLTIAAIDVSRPAQQHAYLDRAYDVVTGKIRVDVKQFSTANAQNSRRLLLGVGFDPRPHWTWSAVGRTPAIRPHQVESRLDDWLKLRHALAHGDPELPAVEVLECVRNNEQLADGPSVRLADAENCVKFVRRLVAATGDGLAQHLSTPAAIWR
ncbi:hypothetical protein [Jiangella alba]|uniref:hypothetical protein n=1 Tax=Jiangella alba TaxID=561176 RepID=UPI00114D24BB|nr:hypothetical protein [Jiangella alba]